VPFRTNNKQNYKYKLKKMKQTLFLAFLLFSVTAFGQKLEWIPFNWVGDSISGKYFDKLAINIPVTLDNLPHKFNMQFDLGAVTTVVYGNSIKPYLDNYDELNKKIDTTLKFYIQSEKNFKFRGVNLKLGTVSFGNRNIGHFKGFGESIPLDSMDTKSEKHIGTIAPDIFQDKILIIDYPNKRICITKELPRQFSKVNFQTCLIKDGRIKITLNINNKEEDLMFDTGSSLYALVTTEARADKISNNVIVDSLKVSSWGEFYMLYGRTVNSTIKYGQQQLKPATVFYDRINKFDRFYDQEKIWGITGNAYFLNNIVIIDYKNKRFGVK
jgi:hypothetical protein